MSFESLLPILSCYQVFKKSEWLRNLFSSFDSLIDFCKVDQIAEKEAMATRCKLDALVLVELYPALSLYMFIQ